MPGHEELLREIEALTLRLRETEETLEAIGSGAVDALVVATPGGEEQLFTLEGADRIYRIFLESITEGAVTLSGDGVILYANEAAERLLSRGSGGELGERLRASVHQDDRERFDALFDAARHQPVSAEILLRSHAGGRPAYLSLRPLGDPSVVVATITDLTELRRTERLLEAERLAGSILEQTSEAIVVCDAQGTIIRASRALRDWIGEDALFRSRDDALPLVTADGREWHASAGDPFEAVKGLEVELRRAGGTARHLIMNVDPLSTSEEGFIGSVMSLTDISERKRAEAALRESEERARFALEAAAMGSIVWYPEDDRAEPDDQFLCLFGLPAGAVVNRAVIGELVHPAYRERHAAAVARSLDPDGNGVLREDVRVVRPDGTELWLAITARSEFARAPRRAVRQYGLAADITARKETEAHQALLLELSDASRSLTDPADIEDLTVRLLAEHLHVDRVHYGEPDGEDLVIRRACGGGLPPMTGRFRLADLGELATAACGSTRTAVCRDVTTDPAVTEAEAAALAGSGVRAYVAVPLVKDGHWVASLAVHSVEPRAWTTAEVSLVEEVGERTWAALERARAQAALRESEAEKAAQAERYRLARDLHDSVTQALFAANLKAEALGLIPDLDAQASGLAGEMRRLSRGALAQMRSLLLELRGDPVEEIPLEQLFRQLAEATEGSTNASVALELSGAGDVPAAVHIAVYRIAQEALNNVAKHAAATEAKVRLELADRRMHLVVEDNGCGFDSCRTSPVHMGMRSMNGRAVEVGGVLTVESTVGRGTLVTFEWSDGDRRS